MDADRFGQLWQMSEDLTEADYRHRVEAALTGGLFEVDGHWQSGELFRLCLPLAIFDAMRVTNYPAFRQRWLELVGAASLPWLPALFAAAAASPHIAADARRALLMSLLLQPDLDS